MTSSRGQNVSVFQHSGSERWKPAFTAMPDTGVNLSGDSRNNSLNFGKKNSRQHLHKTSSTGAYANSRSKDNSFTSTCPNVLMTNTVNSSSILDSGNRELSPVRWCDRKVDGVYLGKSGWVQVHHRSLDDSKGVLYCDNNSFFTLPPRKLFPRADSNISELKENSRPFHLSLSSKKRIIREIHERPSKFAQEFESISPPSVTPIISPPPAFKDDGLNVEFSRQSARKTVCCEESFFLRSGGSSCPATERRNTEQTLPSETSLGSTATSAAALRNDRLPYRTLQTKFLDDDFSSRIWHDTTFNSTESLSSSDFRSPDLDTGTLSNGAKKVNDSDSLYKKFETTQEKINCGECDEEEEEEEEEEINDYDSMTNEYLLRLRNSSKEELNGQRNSSKVFRQKNQRNGRRTSSSCRARSSSSDSSSSGCNLSDKNSEMVVNSRRTNSREKPTFEFEHSSSGSSKQFHVKRSRSLQLSEKRSPCESLFNNCSSGKSWDPMPPEYSTFRTASQNSENSVQFPQNLHHVLVTVNGDSIPVGNSTNQSLNSLSKITTSEEEQKKLIMEAEREARIISEFLNGTRSRTAARNLLMHRYLNRHEDVGSIESSENLSPTAECDAYFSETDRRENFWKRNNANSSNLIPRQHPTTVYSKPFAYMFRASGTSSRMGSVMPPHNFPGEGKKERAEILGSVASNSPFSDQRSKDRRLKNKIENINRCLAHACENSTIEKMNSCALSESKAPKNENLENGSEVFKSMHKNSPQVLTAKKVTKTKAADVEESSPHSSTSSSSSPSSSTSSPDICRLDFGTKLIKKTKKMNASVLCRDVVSGGNPRTHLTFRADSAPESDDSTAAGVYQRSLSLPRSFLSERYRLNYSNQRDRLRWKRQDEETLEETGSERPANSQRSRTAPTTPTRDLNYGKRQESLSQIQCTGSSCTSLLKESAFSSPRRIPEKFTEEDPESLYANSSEVSAFLVYKNLQQMSGKRGRVGSSCETSHLTSALQAIDNDDLVREKAFRFTREQLRIKKGLKSEKYDSHDSGIQMGNRGNIDSSESQDTDLQEDTDSPLMVRKHEIYGTFNFEKRPEYEIFNRASSDQLKGDIQQRARSKKHIYQEGVKRANSDVGNQKLFNLDVKNSGRSLLIAARPPPTRDRHSKTIFESSPREHAAAIRNNSAVECSERFAGTQLRRSLSQPLGLNDTTPFPTSSMLKCFALSEDEKNQRGVEDECLSDSESSVASLLDRKKSFDFPSRAEAAVLAEALWDHVAIESCELPFKAGDVIEVLDTQNWDWWWGATAGNRGYFPSAFVRLRVNQEDTVEDCLAAMAKGKCTSSRLRRGKTVSLLSNDQVRSSVVSELLSTEQDFVKILRDLKDGYIDQCQRRTDMFTPAQITTIFSNLEDLLDFQEIFLKDLEAAVDKEFPYKSCIGKVFLTHGSGFRMYSEYCNSHPMAMATLQDLYQKNGYCKFFETCRLKQSLIEIPLDGYLLTPVQRICKYPLQLAELLKYTKPEHPDFREVEEALETMRAVATLINERKRKMESLEKLAAWQQRVEGWMGEDLIEISSRLIHQGDVVRITSGVWTSNITLFLFDHQIVYCKKDLLKRNVYIYKGRIFLDASIVVDVPDGKNQQLGVTVKYGLKICSSLKDKWLLFCCRSSEDKAKWLEALAEEKRLVAQDREVGLDLPPTAKLLAKMAARTNVCPPYKPRGKNKFAQNHEEMSLRNCHPGTSKTKSSRRVGNWFTFGGAIKNSKTNPRPRTALHRFT